MTNSHVVFLPVYRGVIHATLDKGHRWSDIEHLVLYGLSQKAHTISELGTESNLPREVLLEAIHRLMRAGWVEINETEDRIAFRATNSGLVEADKDSLTPIPREQIRKLYYIVDRLVNTVFESRDFVLYKENKVKELLGNQKDGPQLLLQPFIFDDNLPSYSEIVEPLLWSNEKFVTYNPEKSWISSEFYAKLTVTEEEIEGLPEKAGTSLRKLLVRSVRYAVSAIPKADSPGKPVVPPVEAWPTYKIKLNKEDLYVGGNAHEELFDTLLRNAKKRVIIHSTFLRLEAIEVKLDAFSHAVNQGVEIDILWDRENTDSAGKKLRLCRDLIRDHGLVEKVRIQSTPTGSHAKLLVADDGQGRYLAVVGSCNWLYTGFEPVEVSVCFRNQQMVFDCLGVLEKLIHRPRFRDEQLRVDIVALRNQLRPIKNDDVGPVRARFLSLGCHEECIVLARDMAKRDIFIASHKLGGPVETQMLIPMASAAQERATKVAVYYQKQTGPAEGEEVREALEEKYAQSFSLQQVNKAHAKLLCWDDDHVVITSLNWLSKDIDPQKCLSEIGVYLNGPGLASYVKEKYLANC